MLNDVWRNISMEIGVFWKGCFHDVPATPGTYAWFYPLRLDKYDLPHFVSEVSAVLLYDSMREDQFAATASVDYAWESLLLQIKRNAFALELAPNLEATWQGLLARKDTETFESFRKALMRASLFMPPLYVGRTVNLHERCQQHRSGSGSNDFHGRYCAYASQLGIHARSVDDLIFACIRTTPSEGEHTSGTEGLLEEILKRLCKPPYSMR